MSDKNRHGRNTKIAGVSVGGQFATNARSEADGSVLVAAPPASSRTASEVRSTKFTERVIIDRFKLADGAVDINQAGSSDGGMVVSFTQQFGDYSYPTAIHVDRRGDIAEWMESGSAGWVAVPTRAEELRGRLRVARLTAMGVQPTGGTHDGEHQFTGSRSGETTGMTDAAEVSKLVRKDLKRAVEFGVLPEDWKVSVRTDKYTMGQAVKIYAGAPYGQLNTGARFGEGPIYQAEARSVRDALEAIGNQWNVSESDSMRGYYDSNYHLLVNLEEQPEEISL